jgi:hypothetical protein
LTQAPIASTPLPGKAGRGRLALHVVAFAIVAIIYAIAATRQIDLPGIYMDAVNPDYLAVRILNWKTSFAPWVLPGNDVFGHFTGLVSLYHGTQQLYFALPVFWLLGTSVTSLRIAHALFALAILAAGYALLARSGVNKWLASGLCCALALDPAFVFAFRTPSYITMAPVAWLLLSIAALRSRVDASPAKIPTITFTGGLFFGLAVLGYFIYAFFTPALALAVLLWRAPKERADGNHSVRLLAIWAVGTLCGCASYVLGCVLLARSQDGLTGLFAFVAGYVSDVNPFGAQQSLAARVVSVWQFTESIFYNWWHNAAMFDDYTPVPGAAIKTAMLLGLPALCLLALELGRRPNPALRLLIGLEVSFLAVALVFGSRLGGHHFVALLPLSYFALAIALGATQWSAPQPFAARMQVSVTAVVLAALLVINVAGELHESDRLRATHGVGLYSDAINHFGEDLRRTQNALVFLPDWGLFMPVAFLTGGHVDLVTTSDYAAARRALCAGRSIEVALIEGDRANRFRSWQDALDATPISVRDYRQLDGKVVFQVATFERGSAAMVCAPR